MPKASPIQNSFAGGEWAPVMEGRTDLQKYYVSAYRLRNFLPMIQGPAMRRSGTRYVAEVKDSSNRTALVRFEFSTTQAYIIEFGDSYLRFYKDRGQILSGGSPYEISAPWAQADLFDSDGRLRLKFTQSADVLYVVHPDYAPRRVNRFADTNWTITEVDFQDGPFLPINTTDTTLTPSAASGSITITASATTGINDGNGFQSGDVGRHIRLKINGVWGWCKITAVNSTTSVDADVQGDGLAPAYTASTIAFKAESDPTQDEIRDTDGQFVEKGFVDNSQVSISASGSSNDGLSPLIETVTPDRMLVSIAWDQDNSLTTEAAGANTVTLSGSVSATDAWQLGLYSDTDGWPTAVTFHENRLVFMGPPEYPQRIDASRTGDYPNFAPTEADGTVLADNAYSFTLNAEQVNAIRWGVSGDKGMLIGTVGGEWLLSASSLNEAITPDNVKAIRSTTYGSANMTPERAGNAVLYTQRAARNVRELAYVFESDSYRAPEMTLVSRHVTESGLVDTAFAYEPTAILWACRQDGRLVSFTYERNQDVTAWAQHIVGGTSDGDGSAAKVESVAVIPGQDRDELWLIVQRYIDGSTKRYVEYLEADFDAETEQADAFFVDSGLTYSGSATTTITGLDHLEGETVSVLADGAVHPDRTVSSGEIELQEAASKVQAGLGYTSTLVTQRLEAGAADGTAQGKIKRVHDVAVRLWRTLGGKMGPDTDTLDTIFYRESSMPMGQPPELFTGDKHLAWPSGYEKPARLAFVQDQPYPATVLAIMPQVITQDA